METKQYMKDYYQRNKEAIKERVRKHREENKGKVNNDEKAVQRVKETQRRYREAHRGEKNERNKKFMKGYYEKNKEVIKKKVKKYRVENPNKVTETRVNYEKNNAAKIAEIRKKWQELNKERLNAKARARRATDEQYKIRANLRSRFNKVVRVEKKYTSVLNLLGCSVEYFKQYLEWQFDDNMSWENYGTYWSIDHIRPCASFDLTDPEQQKDCFDFTNMQPLPVVENSRKGNRWEG